MLPFQAPSRRIAMTTLDELRKGIEAALGNLTPTKAQEVAKGFMEPGAAKDQVAKTAADLLEWSQHNRERIREGIRREIAEQLRGMGVATQSELDAVKKRVRHLERTAGMTASGATSRRKTAARKKPAAATKASTAARSAKPAPAD
jgi:polyhydroxyalkanoate synthesis regulator phasin